MAKKIYQSICLVAALILFSCIGILTAVLYGYFSVQTQRELQVETVYVAHGLDRLGPDYLTTLTDRTRRITHIAADGTVLFDNAADQTVMPNHLLREEVAEALESGVGISSRTSETLAEETFYYAKRLEDGSVLRLSATQRSVWALLLGLLLPAYLVVAGALLLGGFLARRVARGIVEPLNALDLEQPDGNDTYEEVAPLLANIARLRHTIDRQLQEARQKQEEFRLITDHMSEGLLVIDAAAELLTCNDAALRLLGADPRREPASVFDLNSGETFREVVDQVLSGRHASRAMEYGSRALQLMASPVYQRTAVTGAVLLVLDVTERTQLEALRREFSANVSHELKTPLTSISGFAELLKSGLVPPEDVPDLSGSIYDEAQRLIRLVQDIIHLSALDEARIPDALEPLDLLTLARDQASRLTVHAEAAQVTLSVTGQSAVVTGSRAVLSETLFNLLDNAVKYNRPGGLVDVTVTAGPRPAVTVRDTGIGIPPEAQSRVFERFYRVDKSRSKAVNGTGLGLSIVKHGAAFHNADLRLESAPGQGTAITLTFP